MSTETLRKWAARPKLTRGRRRGEWSDSPDPGWRSRGRDLHDGRAISHSLFTDWSDGTGPERTVWTA